MQYIAAWWNVVNWDQVNENFEMAKSGKVRGVCHALSRTAPYTFGIWAAPRAAPPGAAIHSTAMHPLEIDQGLLAYHRRSLSDARVPLLQVSV